MMGKCGNKIKCGEQRSSAGFWMNRKGIFCLCSSLSAAVVVSGEHLFCSLFVLLKAGIIILFLLVQERQSAVYGCQDIWWSATAIRCFVGGGGVAWRVFKVSLHRDWSCSLGHDERLKQTQVADLMDALKRGPQSNKAYHIFWKRAPFFYYVICQRHRKPH